MRRACALGCLLSVATGCEPHETPASMGPSTDTGVTADAKPQADVEPDAPNMPDAAPDVPDATPDAWIPPPGLCGEPSDDPLALAISWDGSFMPGDDDFPLPGLLDDRYSEEPLALPPGAWDATTPGDATNWALFQEQVGTFVARRDASERQVGWTLVPRDPTAPDLSGAGAYYEGSQGVDVVDLGSTGAVHSYTSGSLGAGPDVLVFDRSWSLRLRTGSNLTGSYRDNDLVVAGCGNTTEGELYGISGTTIHTGPCADTVFARDMTAAAIDAGNGADGRTNVLDPTDGDDVVVFRGNMRDFRFFGGWGDDVAVWWVDEIGEDITLLGPNFFGGGGAGSAVWSDPGTDRLVLVVPDDTVVVDAPPTPKGGLLVHVTPDYQPTDWWDPPTYADPFARYCITCGVSPEGRRTLALEYVSATGPAVTGFFWITAFEELQLGLGPTARVFRVDDVQGALEPAPDLAPFDPPEQPPSTCQ